MSDLTPKCLALLMAMCLLTRRVGDGLPDEPWFFEPSTLVIDATNPAFRAS